MSSFGRRLNRGWMGPATLGLALALSATHAAAQAPPPAPSPSPGAPVQTPQMVAQAQALFDEGRRLMDETKYDEACKAFEESQKLSPAVGTQLNLANCYEQDGRTASAWAMYRDVETLARRAEQKDREELARERAEKLEPTLSRLTVTVKDPPKGLKITRDGTPVVSSAWGRAIPVDPGEWVLRAEAPGKKPWSTTIGVGADADAVSVDVPALADAPVEPSGKEGVAEREEVDNTVGIALGVTAIALGVGGVGAGVALRLVALGTDEDSLAHCLPDDPFSCTQEGQDLRDEAQALQLGSVIAWAGGGALLVTGVVVVVVMATGGDVSEGESAIDWNVDAGPDHGMLQLRARW